MRIEGNINLSTGNGHNTPIQENFGAHFQITGSGEEISTVIRESMGSMVAALGTMVMAIATACEGDSKKTSEEEGEEEEDTKFPF